MKPTSSPILLVLLIFSTLYLPSSFAEDYTQWGLPEGAKVRIGKGSINDIRYSPDGTILAVAGSVGIWLYDAETLQELTLLRKGRKGKYGVRNISFSPDSTTLVSGYLDDVIFWDVTAREHKKTYERIGSSVLLSPDGLLLVSKDYKGIHLSDAKTGDGKKTIVFKRLNYRPCILFSPDGRTLAGAHLDGPIPLWDTKTGKLKKTLIGHAKNVYTLSFSPDGKTLASGSRDHTVRLWDVETGTLQKTFIGHTETVYSVSFSPGGRILATGSEDKTIRLWDVNTGKLKENTGACRSR